MDSREIDSGPTLSSDGREGAGAARTIRIGENLKASAPFTLLRSELMRIYAGTVMPAREWTGPVFYAEEPHASVASLQTALRKKDQALPPFAYGSRILKAELNAKNVMNALFPDGIPKTDKLNAATQAALRNVMEAIKHLYETPGMQQLEIDKSIIVICNEQAFINMMENSIAKTGEEL